MVDTLAKIEIINKFAETVGMEKATDLIAETCQTVALVDKERFNKAEALKLLDVLRQKGGMIGIIAGFMASEAHLMNE
jgi:outer membrane receptor for monomeric catechols